MKNQTDQANLTNPTKKAFDSIQLPLVILSYLGCAVYGLIATAKGSIYPDLLSTFHVSNTEGSLFYSLASATGLAANLLTYKWYPKFGPIRATTIFLFLTAVGTWLVAAGPVFSLTIAGAGLLGFAMGGTGLLFNVLAAHSTQNMRLRRQVLSGLHASYGIASMLAPLVVTALASCGLDWRMIFVVLGFAPLAVTILSWKTRETGSSNEWKDSFSESKPWRRTIWYASVCTLYVAAETILQTRLVQYGRDSLGFDVSQANYLLSGFFLTFFLGRFVFTLIPFRHSNFAILMTSSLLSLAFYLGGLYINPWGLAFAGLGCSVFYPCLMAYLTDELKAATAFTMSWCQTAQSAGMVLMHVGVGWMSDKFGLPTAMLVGPFCLAAVAALLMVEKRRSSPAHMAR
jgi:FHS family glucose/mannose:H+ symporter-like MFS transporter